LISYCTVNPKENTMTLNMRTGHGTQPEIGELLLALGDITGNTRSGVGHRGDVRFTKVGDPALPSPRDAKAFCGIVEFSETFTLADMAADQKVVTAMMASLIGAWEQD
jgi:hypothetical protein